MTSIEWTDQTWNPVTGCSKVSPGCAHCYAEEVTALRAGRPGFIEEHRPWTPANAEHNVRLWPARLEQPLSWRRPRMVFVNSMSDLFHEEIPDEYIARVFAVMAMAAHHTFQVLTKRPERMKAWFDRVAVCEHGWLTHNGENPTSYGGTGHVLPDHLGWPIPNVWLGVSIENRRFVDRADLLRETPAAVRFISAEPLLGPLVPLASWDEGYEWYDGIHPDAGLSLAGIDWCIAGGESGPRARRLDLSWMRDLRDACAAAGTAYFVKQLGGARPGSRLEDLPEDLRIREMAGRKPAAPGPGLCERVLVGRGTETWDPLCGRLKGHEGPCE